ncbi:MAG TPA: histidinol-phosphate transaminase [Lactobacillaceae bacterium]|jgi:histidinol-phosphate aminotransferase
MKMKPQVRTLAAYQPEVPNPHVVRLSANENVFGASPKVAEALQNFLADTINYYPDGQATPLRQALSQLTGIAAEKFVLGVGLDEIIQLLSRVLLTPTANIVTATPTFSEYELHADIEGSHTKAVPVLEDGHVDFAGMLAAVDEQTALVVLTNPNNPTGVFESVADITSFLDKLPREVTLFVDEAYFEFVAEEVATVLPLVAQYENLVVGRTLSKAYGLANLRVGYAVMNEPLLSAMQAVRLPYNLSTFQQTAAVTAVRDQAYLRNVVTVVQQEREQWQTFLREQGYDFYASQGNFVYVAVSDAKRYAQELLAAGFQVKAYPAVQRLRFSMGAPADMARMRAVFLTLKDA